MSNVSNSDQFRRQWLERLADLIQTVQSWAGELGWATRRIEVPLEDSQLGRYKAPALLIQEDSVRILLEPIASAAPGAEGVVDLYLMPEYDDIASFYFYGGGWSIHYMFPGTETVATIQEAEGRPLTRDTLRDVLEEMKRNGVQQI